VIRSVLCLDGEGAQEPSAPLFLTRPWLAYATLRNPRGAKLLSVSDANRTMLDAATSSQSVVVCRAANLASESRRDASSVVIVKAAKSAAQPTVAVPRRGIFIAAS